MFQKKKLGKGWVGSDQFEFFSDFLIFLAWQDPWTWMLTVAVIYMQNLHIKNVLNMIFVSCLIYLIRLVLHDVNTHMFIKFLAVTKLVYSKGSEGLMSWYSRFILNLQKQVQSSHSG